MNEPRLPDMKTLSLKVVAMCRELGVELTPSEGITVVQIFGRRWREALADVNSLAAVVYGDVQAADIGMRSEDLSADNPDRDAAWFIAHSCLCFAETQLLNADLRAHKCPMRPYPALMVRAEATAEVLAMFNGSSSSLPPPTYKDY